MRLIWDRERRDFVPADEYVRAPSATDDKRADFPSPQVMGDVQPFQSPIDKSWITSRPQVREHEKKHNVRQVGNDLKPKDFKV
jgi:hypothetical protein